MNETIAPLRVFLCYASTDKSQVRELHHELKRWGIQPWMSSEDLLPGTNWEREIQREIAASHAIIICLTKNSVSKQGYFQKEIKFALDRDKEMPEGQIFIIPVKLEECEIPRDLKPYQYLDLAAEDDYSRLLKSLEVRASQLERTLVRIPTTLDQKDENTIKIQDDVGTNNPPVPADSGQKGNDEKIKDGPSKKSFSWAAVCFILLLFVCAVLLGIRAQMRIPIESTQTAEAKLRTGTAQLISYIDTLPPTVTSTPTLTNTPTFTPTLTPLICPYEGKTDHETIVNLIMAEADAVNAESLDIIHTIFAPNADFYDYAKEPPAHWSSADARYAIDLFPKTEFDQAKHFDILPAGSGIAEDTAYYTSGSRGKYRNKGSLAWKELDNGSVKSTQYGSDHWILKKNTNGCWIIIEMQFNAGDEKFP